jgi:menaquinone-specific isochorismate synthase
MNYSAISENLTKFLSGRDIIREIKSSSRIISFAIPADSFIQPAIDTLSTSFKTIFYFSRKTDNLTYFTVGELLVISENGNGRFSAIEKKIRNLQSKIITNWEKSELRVPLFTGSMKFTVEHNDSDWKDFNDSNWIMPEYIFLSDKGENYIIHNFYYDRNTNIPDIIKNLERKLYLFLKQAELNGLHSSKILSVTGELPKDKKKWKNIVNKALAAIDENELKKIVLSRRVEILLDKEPQFNTILQQLESKYPGCGVFLFKNNNSVFFGATPERLALVKSRNILIDALAGSASSQLESTLFTSKNIKEHDFVLEHILNSITPFSERTELTRYHNTKKLNNISHIWSEISAELKEEYPVFAVLKELFPTPAICGTPKDSAMELIRKLEDHRRGLYSGIIGWFNFSDAEFYISIRSALSCGKKIIAYAGCGIIEGSDPDQEFTETELKLIPILSLFRNEKKDQPEYHLD